MRFLFALSLASLVMVIGGPTAFGAPDETGTAPSGSITIALLDVATELKDDPRANVYITDNVAPGKTITHQVRVTNRTGKEAALDVYVGPANIVDGTFSPRSRGEKNALTSWITVDKPELTLADGQSDDVTVTIAVPEDAPETEQYGVVWASTRSNSDTDGVQVVSRVGVRTYLSVGAGNGPPSDFTITEVTSQRDGDGNATVVAAVRNTGGRAVDLNGTLDLTGGPGGLTAQTVSAQTVTVGPSGDGIVSFTVPNSATLPAGPWQAAVKLESGFNKHDMSAAITFPDKGVGDTVGASGSGWSIGVWIGLAVGVLVLALALAAYVLRNRRGGVAAGALTEASSEPDR
ncbi:Peptidase [Prescottella defluvii]|uniref:hypothetical protein n=1 Tax=Prescottella defluvii TaxID=1323361 RepID=UPI000689DDB2|nr:hypothetical protein [Prescottella defluvii]